MSDAKLWIDEVGCTATIAGTNVSYTMPLWVFDVMRDIIGAEAEKKVEVTHRDFDTQQELLDRHRAENVKLRELVKDMFGGYKGAVEMLPSSYSKNVAERAVMDISDRMRELGVEVDG